MICQRATSRVWCDEDQNVQWNGTYFRWIVVRLKDGKEPNFFKKLDSQEYEYSTVGGFLKIRRDYKVLMKEV